MITVDGAGERRPAASLVGEAGKENGEKLVLLALGHISLDEAGPAFSFSPNGGIELVVDRATWEAFGFNAGHANGDT